jgi:hypothetical protein
MDRIDRIADVFRTMTSCVGVGAMEKVRAADALDAYLDDYLKRREADKQPPKPPKEGYREIAEKLVDLEDTIVVALAIAERRGAEAMRERVKKHLHANGWPATVLNHVPVE